MTFQERSPSHNFPFMRNQTQADKRRHKRSGAGNDPEDPRFSLGFSPFPGERPPCLSPREVHPHSSLHATLGPSGAERAERGRAGRAGRARWVVATRRTHTHSRTVALSGQSTAIADHPSESAFPAR